MASRPFLENLAQLRRVAWLDTDGIHGSTSSNHDNRLLFKVVTFREVALLGEPYISWANAGLAYLTDTGRPWNAASMNVRDRLEGSDDLRFRNTLQICAAIDRNEFPQEVMVTTHPQRWADSFGPWCWELAAQNVKNLAKVPRGASSNANRASF